MKSHGSEGVHFRRERRFIIDPRNGRGRSIVLQVLGIATGSLICAGLLAIVIL